MLVGRTTAVVARSARSSLLSPMAGQARHGSSGDEKWRMSDEGTWQGLHKFLRRNTEVVSGQAPFTPKFLAEDGEMSQLYDGEDEGSDMVVIAACLGGTVAAVPLVAKCVALVFGCELLKSEYQAVRDKAAARAQLDMDTLGYHSLPMDQYK
eukprot:gnl/Spiro4/3730_TR1826_c0_g1_i1.p1 gnl/Spiro4/3730_TR1826_c0_g1~~gnl/Spiro4/3730_TR1826_c0_g1_i1.p1  ORF type:complete len:168 (-),score=44.91 gnl/Spiro4/3730_TR1826_c0_g1_i1:136-591(-)